MVSSHILHVCPPSPEHRSHLYFIWSVSWWISQETGGNELLLDLYYYFLTLRLHWGTRYYNQFVPFISPL